MSSKSESEENSMDNRITKIENKVNNISNFIETISSNKQDDPKPAKIATCCFCVERIIYDKEGKFEGADLKLLETCPDMGWDSTEGLVHVSVEAWKEQLERAQNNCLKICISYEKAEGRSGWNAKQILVYKKNKECCSEDED